MDTDVLPANPEPVSHPASSRWRVFGFLFFLWAVIYLPGLGQLEIKGEEGRRILPAVTMLDTGNWVLPSVGGEPYYNKPPFINWLIALSFKISGVQNEFFARLPSVLMVLGFVTLLVWMPSGFLTNNAKLVAGVIFLTNLGIIEKGRLVEIEAVYVCLTGMAILWWLNLWAAGASAWLMWIGSAVFLSCAMLTKGPAHLLFFYAAVVAVCAASGRLKTLLHPAHWIALVIVFGPAWGWLAVAKLQGAGSEMTQQMSSQFMDRILPSNYQPVKNIESILESAFFLFPWLLFAGAFWQKKYLQNLPQNQHKLYRGCLWGLAVSFLIINLIPGAFSRYTMPFIPIAAILLGWVLSYYPAFEGGEKLWKKIIISGAYVLPVFTIAALIFTATQKGVGAIVSLSSLLLVVATALLCHLIAHKEQAIDNVRSLAQVTGLFVAACVLQYTLITPLYAGPFENRRPVGTMLNAAVGDETLAIYKPGYQAFIFYIDVPIEYVVDPAGIEDKGISNLLIKKDDWQQLVLAGDIKPEHWAEQTEFNYRDKATFKFLKPASD